MGLDATRMLEAASRAGSTTLLIIVLATVIWLLADRIISREDVIIDRLGEVSARADETNRLLRDLVDEVRDMSTTLVWRVAETCPSPRPDGPHRADALRP